MGRVLLIAAVNSDGVKQLRLSCNVEMRWSKHVECMNCSPDAGAIHITLSAVLSLPTRMDVVVPNLNGFRAAMEGELLRMEGRLVWDVMVVGRAVWWVGVSVGAMQQRKSVIREILSTRINYMYFFSNVFASFCSFHLSSPFSLIWDS